MKRQIYKTQHYRQWVKADDFIRTHISVQETDLYVLTDKPLNKGWFKKRVIDYRRKIQDYIIKDTRFLNAIKPIALALNAPDVINRMVEASKLANVGPMAAVAGTVAQLLCEDLINMGYKEVIIENGGDIFMTRQKKNRLVAIFAGDSKFSGKLGLLIKPEQTPCGICTSSATFGHSLSFGSADSVVIVAKDACIADAVATAACNLVKSKDDFDKVIKFTRGISGVFGMIIILANNLASWGRIQIDNLSN